MNAIGRLQCGRAVLPAPGAVAGSCAAALAAFGAGAAAARWSPRPRPGAEAAARLCALALLYMQCCDALQTRGSVRVEDMFAVLLLGDFTIFISLTMIRQGTIILQRKYKV